MKFTEGGAHRRAIGDIRHDRTSPELGGEAAESVPIAAQQVGLRSPAGEFTSHGGPDPPAPPGDEGGHAIERPRPAGLPFRHHDSGL